MGHICDANPTQADIGRTISTVGEAITENESSTLFSTDISRTERDLKRSQPFFVLQTEQRRNVLLDMGFNLGAAGIAEFKKMWAAIGAGDYTAAAAEMLDSAWASQVGTRSTTLASMMARDEFYSEVINA